MCVHRCNPLRAQQCVVHIEGQPPAISFDPTYLADAFEIGSTLVLVDGLNPGMTKDPSGNFCLVLNQRFAEDKPTVGVAGSSTVSTKFGMFIHWGIFSIPAGEWNGKMVEGNVEWIKAKAKIPDADYDKLASRFNPVKFNAEEWAQLAENAGMKYLVFVAKHHDGFAMFASKADPYNVVDATP